MTDRKTVSQPHGAMSAAAESSGAVSYRAAIGRALSAIENDCLSDGMRGKEKPCESCTAHMNALRALAGLVAEAEQAAAKHDPAVCTCQQHIGQQLIASLAAGSSRRGNR